MSDKETRSEGGIALQYAGASPYDLPEAIQVEAKDPEEEKPEEESEDATPAEEEEEEEANEDEQEAGPSEEEMLDEIENSPGVQWKKYLRPILKIVKDTKLRVPIELHNSYAIGIDDDTSLGFHITGVVHFLGEVPADVAAQLDGGTLRFDASVTPDGTISGVDLVYPTLKPSYEPTFHINRNVDRL